MTSHDKTTSIACLHVPKSSLIELLYDLRALFPRLALSAVLSVLFFALFTATAAAQVGGASLNNPLNPEFSTVPGFIAGALRVLVMVSLPIITLFIVYAGFKFVAAQGRDEALAQAKMNLMYVVIGSILILGAWVIATLIGGTVSEVVGR